MRSSCESVEVNSFFMRSASSWAVMSRPCAMTAITSFWKLTSGVTVHSQIISAPSRRGLRILSPATDSRAETSCRHVRSKSSWNLDSTSFFIGPPTSSAAA